jgi:hypothetical protein
MYPAITTTTNHIAEQAYKVWRVGGECEATIDALCKEANVTDWRWAVKGALSRIIESEYLKRKCSGY